MRTISHFINGQSVTRPGAVTSPVYDPGTGQVQALLEHGDAAILAEAVAAAKAAQPAWAALNPQQRARVLFKYKALIEEHRQEIVHLMSSEHGKLLGDSAGELQRGLDVVEFMCGVPHLQKGEFTQGAGPGVNSYSIREPLGVVAGIPPFNFPGMIPLWMIAPAIAVGNAIILKPSERCPSAALRLVELAHAAGVPPGIVNIVHGAKEVGDLRGGDQLSESASRRQCGYRLHAQRRLGPAFRCRGPGRHGGSQFSFTHTSRLLQPWRLERLGFRRPEPIWRGQHSILHAHQERNPALASQRTCYRPKLHPAQREMKRLA